MNTTTLNTRPLNNYSTYGVAAARQPVAVVDGMAATASIGTGAVVQRHSCSGEALPFTWGIGTISQGLARVQGVAVHNGIGYGGVTAPLARVNGEATTGWHATGGVIQPVATISGLAWSTAIASGSVVQPPGVCKGESVSTPVYSVLRFSERPMSAITLTDPAPFTILKFTRD